MSVSAGLQALLCRRRPEGLRYESSIDEPDGAGQAILSDQEVRSDRGSA